MEVNSRDLKFKRSKLRREAKNIENINKKIRQKIPIF